MRHNWNMTWFYVFSIGWTQPGKHSSSVRVVTHYSNVIMSAIASQIIGVSIVYPTIFSRADRKKTSKLRVTGLYEGNPPVTRKMFPFDDVIMNIVNYVAFKNGNNGRASWALFVQSSSGWGAITCPGFKNHAITCLSIKLVSAVIYNFVKIFIMCVVISSILDTKTLIGMLLCDHH